MPREVLKGIRPGVRSPICINAMNRWEGEKSARPSFGCFGREPWRITCQIVGYKMIEGERGEKLLHSMNACNTRPKSERDWRNPGHAPATPNFQRLHPVKGTVTAPRAHRNASK